nr:potassium channel SKOR-like isoform X3 [Ipomoea trifida]
MDGGRRRSSGEDYSEEEEEYRIEDLGEGSNKSSWKKFSFRNNINCIPSSRQRQTPHSCHGFLIHPDNRSVRGWAGRWYLLWTQFILIWAVYSSFFTPLEFGFFRGLPENLFLLDIAGQIAFLIDVVVRFFVAYRDAHSYRIVFNPNQIAIRYLKSRFLVDVLGCFPWDAIYKACGRKELVRYLLWIRLSRALRVTEFFEKLEKDIRINYLFTRIVKLFVVELYCTHTAACIFYYLATTLPPSQEGYTWIGSLRLGDYSYAHFRDIDLWKRYITSLYFAIVTMATVGYGEIHAVNIREMIFVMAYVSLDMILGAYLLGNMAALIVRGSKTERFRDKMADLIKYMNRNKLGKNISKEIKNHVRLQYESSYPEAEILQHIPVSIRAKMDPPLLPVLTPTAPLVKFLYCVISRFLTQFKLVNYLDYCELISKHFWRLSGKDPNLGKKILESDITLNISKHESELAMRLNCAAHEGDLYRLRCLIGAGADPAGVDYNGKSPLHLAASKGHEDIAQFLVQKGVNINLRDNFGNNPLFEAIKGGHDHVTCLLVKAGASLDIEDAGSCLCNVVAKKDIQFLRRLLDNGVNPNSKNYDLRTPLHLAASEGFYQMSSLLLEAGATVFAMDRRGITPLDEARVNGNKKLIKLLEDVKNTQISMHQYKSSIEKIHDAISDNC